MGNGQCLPVVPRNSLPLIQLLGPVGLSVEPRGVGILQGCCMD